MNIVVGLLKTMRPKQWTKNLILFAGVLFSNNLFDTDLLKVSLIGFILFCIFSGNVYIVNDLVDKEKDQLHPKKCNRPIASGKVSITQAIIFLCVSLIFSFFLAYKLDYLFFIVGLFYSILVILYSFVLKHRVILDVMTISIGFVLRAVAGVVLIDVRISPWLLLCTFLLSLFLALHKRKSEVDLITKGNKKSRKILEEYTPELLNDMLHIVTSSTVMAYSLYTFSASKSMYMMVTIPFVVYGIFRYQYIVHRKGMGENPELVLLSDIPLIVDILLWSISCIFILYFI
ncbi:MAG: decaprenyl-phosphate phosphoribosyltransferase [Marinisporobacter sp.]|jgi:4-hydroxybenzoate polyprenyltransferase|nr:decaprenyl-phosphate phosphoribosyltransferase [Marinisporobacter sp.]